MESLVIKEEFYMVFIITSIILFLFFLYGIFTSENHIKKEKLSFCTLLLSLFLIIIVSISITYNSSTNNICKEKKCITKKS